MRQIFISTIVVFGVVVVTLSLASPGLVLTYILQAFAAEEHAPKKHAELIFRRGDIETFYIIDRVLPDRLHMYSREGDREQELYIIAERMYRKGSSGWVTTPALPQASTPFSVVDLFENQLQNIQEQDPVLRNGIEHRVFEGTISWLAGRSRNEGEIQIFIDTKLVLPSLMTFTGMCGTSECAFEYTMTYDPTIVIEAPVP